MSETKTDPAEVLEAVHSLVYHHDSAVRPPVGSSEWSLIDGLKALLPLPEGPTLWRRRGEEWT